MKNRLLRQHRAIGGAVLLALVSAGCTGRVDQGPGGTGSGGSGSGGSNPGSGTGGTGGSGANGATGGTGLPGTGGGSPTGTGGGTALDPNTIVKNPPAFAPAPGLLRRLTRTQFRNALSDVFGYVLADLGKIDTDSWDSNFANIGASVVVTSDKGAEEYNTVVEAAVDAVFADATKRATFIGCTPTGQAADTCLRGYLQKLGLRAWRRPLTSAELDALGKVAAGAATTLGTAAEGARWATVALFESPNFLYRPELGAGALRFTDHEMAGRLSFLIWNSLPDQMLLDQATNGMLRTPEGIRTAVTRLLDAPAGRESVGNFAEEYLRLDRIATQAKDASLFPEYGAALQVAMVRDVRDTWASLVFDDQTNVMSIFTTTKVVVNSDLAKLYGLPTTGLTSTTFQTKSLPADGPRAGLLTKAALLSDYANQQWGSPTLRGKFIRESLMCGIVPLPPDGVDLSAADQLTDKPTTKRQRLELHRSAAGCAACHSLMDPLGLPLENFDAVGKYRATENGLTIDPSGTFDGRPVANSRELGVAASESVTVAQCLVRKFHGYAMGRPERPADGTVLNSLAATFSGSGYKMRDLIVAVVTHDAFSSVAPQP
jgi:hypothetical protein